MSERNVFTLIIVLLLPLSFGLDPGPGRDMPQNASVGDFSGTDAALHHSQLIPLTGPVGGSSVIPTAFATSSIRPVHNTDAGVFESSLSTNVTQETEPCDSTLNSSDEVEPGGPSAECPASVAETIPEQSNIGLPLQSSFSGSIAADDNRTAGSVDPIGGGGGGGGRQPSPDTPISTPEPGSLLSLLCGLVALGGLARKKSQPVCAAALFGEHQ